jgi:hypothetical protein
MPTREEVKARIKASSKGGRKGQWYKVKKQGIIKKIAGKILCHPRKKK